VGVVAIATSIFNLENKPVAAVTVLDPEYQMGEIMDSKVAEEVKRAAERISGEL